MKRFGKLSKCIMAAKFVDDSVEGLDFPDGGLIPMSVILRCKALDVMAKFTKENYLCSGWDAIGVGHNLKVLEKFGYKRSPADDVLISWNTYFITTYGKEGGSHADNAVNDLIKLLVKTGYNVAHLKRHCSR